MSLNLLQSSVGHPFTLSFLRKQESTSEGWNKVHRYFVYILASKRDGVLYIGVTNDLPRRVWEHKEGLIAGFSKQYYVEHLVYFEEFPYIDQAIAREKSLKRWKREWKIDLIEKMNPEWKDLFKELNNLL